MPLDRLQPSRAERLDRLVESHDHVLGPPGVPITLVEYGSYLCSYCRTAHEVVRKLRGDAASGPNWRLTTIRSRSAPLSLSLDRPFAAHHRFTSRGALPREASAPSC
jgi:hypothetical protein